MLAQKILVAAPTGIAVTNHVGYSLIDWTDITDSYFAKIELWVNTADDLGTASKVADTDSRTFLRAILPPRAESGAVYYAWLRCISIYGDAGPYSTSVQLAPRKDIVEHVVFKEDWQSGAPAEIQWDGILTAAYGTWGDGYSTTSVLLTEANSLYDGAYEVEALADVELTGTPTLGTDDGGYVELVGRVRVSSVTLPAGTINANWYVSRDIVMARFWRQGGVYLSRVSPLVFRERFSQRLYAWLFTAIPSGQLLSLTASVEFVRRRSGGTWDLPTTAFRIGRGHALARKYDLEV